MRTIADLTRHRTEAAWLVLQVERGILRPAQLDPGAFRRWANQHGTQASALWARYTRAMRFLNDLPITQSSLDRAWSSWLETLCWQEGPVLWGLELILSGEPLPKSPDLRAFLTALHTVSCAAPPRTIMPPHHPSSEFLM
jgi:hypothetical protein